MTDEVGVNRCLEYINIYLTHNDNSVKNLRRFLDGWHAYSKGGSLLTRGGNVRLLNNPDCSKPIVRKCLEDMDFISVDARNVLNGKAEHRLIVEHAIPIKVIRKKLKTMSSPTLLEIQECLKKHYRIGLLTKEEDNKINARGLNSSMPKGWNGQEPYGYRASLRAASV